MTTDQLLIFAVMGLTTVLFVNGRWRHDTVALAALLAAVLTGLVPGAQAFAGFGHPAVITVAAVLILSRGLQSTGAIDALAGRLLPSASGPTVTIAALTALAALLSAFMNNVGALALLMPMALQIAERQQVPPGKVLMPLAFASILGGMTTLIGTPPNLIVSAFRAEGGGSGFAMFDFTPVGLAVAAAGVAFIALIGWRIVPTREKVDTAGFDVGAYLTEARVTEKSRAAGESLADLEAAFAEADAQVVGLVRQRFRLSAPHPRHVLRAGDILVIEAEPKALTGLLSSLGLTLEEDVRRGPRADASDAAEEAGNRARDESGEIALREVVVRADSALLGRSAASLLLRTRFGISLLAIARQGHRSIRRLRSTPILAGDVLLLQGTPEALASFAAQYQAVPLAPRDIRIPDRGRAAAAAVIMLAAIGGAAFGLLPAAIAFSMGVLAFVVLRLVPPRDVYDAVDWPVIVLLGALIPVAGAIGSTGAADLIAHALLGFIGPGQPVVALTAILVVTMVLSDFMNNAATAAVMCPIAISTAGQLGVNADTFLMAVAVGASCAFLTPIGHQNNTLILGPGGLRFGDYWRLGLLVELVVLVVGVPVLLRVWPL